MKAACLLCAADRQLHHLSGKAPGRGAYLCPDPECLKKAIRSKALSRSLETEIPQEVYDRLEEEMEQQNG